MSSNKKKEAFDSIPVDIYVTFVAAKAGSDPKIKIDNPDNLSYEITGITCDSYDDLLEELEDYVANEEYEHSFHFDKAHSYRIDGRAWQHGTAIYGRKKKDAGGEGGVD